MNNMNSDAVVKNYEEHGALLRGHFLLSSGLHSDAYLQSELIMQDPANAKKVISGLAGVLKDLDFTTIVSPAIGGIRFGYELASQMNKRTLFTERVDGVMTFRRGFTLQKGEKILVAEDVVTTGKSTKECMKAVEEAGGIVVGIASIIDRSSGTAGFTVPFYPLAAVDVKSYNVEECPMCKEGIPCVKPGSRVFAK